MSNLENNTSTLQSILEEVRAIPALTFDTAPTAGSTNPVTSDGIKQYVDNATNHTHNEYAPAYTYGTEDLTAGSSALETGKLYFVYE